MKSTLGRVVPAPKPHVDYIPEMLQEWIDHPEGHPDIMGGMAGLATILFWISFFIILFSIPVYLFIRHVNSIIAMKGW